MTDNEKLARWQGWKVQPRGKVTPHIPDYRNDATACDSLLDTLVEKGFDVRLQSFLEDLASDRWQCSLWQIPTEQNDYDGSCIVDMFKPTRRAAVVAAVLELIGKELEG